MSDAPLSTDRHTPGPWSCAQVWRGPETKIHVEFEGRRVALAEVFTMYSAGEKEANARLIAAAPELYAICRDMLDWVHGKREGRAVTDALTSRLVAAIDKAEGRS